MTQQLYRFMDFLPINEEALCEYKQLAGSYAVIRIDGKYLICYNKWRKQWELPAGGREQNETPKQCAMRELFEETGQKVSDLQFIGLLQSKHAHTGALKHNPVYFAEMKNLQPFIENDEIVEIQLWDASTPLDHFDPLDRKILDYIK